MKDQIDCGSCTAFGTLGVWETLIRVARNDPNFSFDLSERCLFTCSGGGCDQGNTMEAVLDQAVKGVCLEEKCPYDASDHPCQRSEGKCPADKFFRIKSWRRVTDVDEMKTLLKSGPLVGTMTVYQSFINYVSGVYHSLGWLDFLAGYHCIGIFGNDDSLSAWLLRNSWSKDWGMEGYAWIEYGDSDIDKEMFLIEPLDVPEPAPEPEPEWDFWEWLMALIEKWWPF